MSTFDPRLSPPHFITTLGLLALIGCGVPESRVATLEARLAAVEDQHEQQIESEISRREAHVEVLDKRILTLEQQLQKPPATVGSGSRPTDLDGCIEQIGENHYRWGWVA